jgi:O-antigen/teichoic acid export membrane protein
LGPKAVGASLAATGPDVSPLVRRVVAALGANAFGQGINIIIQLASLPLFLHRWDVSTYGTWLMLSAMPAYLSMADVGMVSTAGNRMTMDMAQGRVAQANAVFQSALVFMLLACGGFLLLSLPVVMLAPVPGLTVMDERLALAALVCGVLLALFGGLTEAIFKATGRYALGTTLSTLIRFAEWGGWIVGLLGWGSFSAVAVGGLCARVLGVTLMGLLSLQDSQGLRWGVRHAHWAEIRSMARPALSFMLFPLANAISFQGITLLVGQQFGPAIVTVFNTYRTIARVAVQVTAMFGHALWAEFSRLFGQGGAAGVLPMYQRSAWLGMSLSMGLSLALYAAGPTLLKLWTHGAIEFYPALMLILLSYAAVCGSWHVPRVLLMATNQHIGLAQWSLLAASLAFGLAYALGSVWDIAGVGVGMLMAEMAIALMCIVLAHRLVRPA